MAKTENISQWYKDENSALRERLQRKMEKAGLVIGADVERRMDKARFRLYGREITGISDKGGRIILQGHKLSVSGNYGERLHNIGTPEEVRVL